MAIQLHQGDLPQGFAAGDAIAVDTETMGLKPRRDRLCLVQLSTGDGDVHLVKFDRQIGPAPRLRAVLADPAVLKIFHFARFDVAVLQHFLNVAAHPIWCTKIASRLVRTYTDRHGLKDLSREVLGIELNKQEQSSDWGAGELTQAQQRYAAGDVLHLHELKAKLDDMLRREGRAELAQACFDFLPTRARLDLAGWDEQDIFAH